MRKKLKLKNKDNETVINISSLSIEDQVDLKIKELKDKPIDETVKYAKELSKKLELKTLTLLELLVALKIKELFKKQDEK